MTLLCDVKMTSITWHALLQIQNFISDDHQQIETVFTTFKNDNCTWTIQALSVDFHHACGKMHTKILLGVRHCAKCIFLFLKFYDFIERIMRIYILFLENLGRMPYTALVNLYENYVTELV